MSTLTVFGKTSDGYVESGGDAVYANARAMLSPTVNDTLSTFRVGQRDAFTTNFVDQSFIQFDTSALGANAVISAVILSLWPTNDQTTTEFTIEARVHDWGTSLTTADAVSGVSLSGKTRVATKSTVGLSVGAYSAFTEDGTNFRNAINKTGDTRLILVSDRQVSGVDPTNTEYVDFSSADVAGTNQDPKLVITYTIPFVPRLTVF